MLSRLLIPTALIMTMLPAAAQKSAPIVVEDELEANFDFRCVVKPVKLSNVAPKGSGQAASVLLGSGSSPLSLNLGADSLQLTRKIGGEITVLASMPIGAVTKAAGVPLVLQWRNGSLRVVWDGKTVLRRDGLGALKEGAALATTAGRYQFAQAQCQPVEPVAFADDFMRVAGDNGQWESLSGDWKIHSASDPSKVANAFTYVAQGKPAIAIAGRWFWDDYRLSAAVRPSGQSAVGLIVCWQDAQNYLLFRWMPEDDAHARGREKQLWRMWRGQPSLIAAAPGGYRAKQWYQLSLSTFGGLLTAGIDGQTVLQKRTDLFGQGKAGLYSSGDQSTLIDDVTVDHVSNSEQANVVHREAITPQFTKEESMENWASPKSEWLSVGDAANPTWWNRGTFFGDYAVQVKATALELNRAKVVAILGGDGQSPSSGYALSVTQSAKQNQVEASLLRRGKVIVAARSVTLGADGCTLKLERSGQTVRAYIGRQLVASYADAAPLNGRRAGYAVQGAQISPEESRVEGGNVYDYTFYRAPTDWYVGGGTWDMTSRWDCTPTWSWYGGWSERIAAIWNKHSFGGDFAMDVFVACKRDGGTYRSPRDFNITIGGDGRDLGSGYSLIFGGWNNTVTRLMRGTQVVAETTKILLPKDYQGQAHHKWFNLRVEKTGNLLSLYVDRELALQYRDSKPLPGRRVALWTYGNSITIARATLYYQNELAAEAVPPLIDNEGLRTVAASKLGWTARGNDSIRLDAVTDGAPVKSSTPTSAPVAAVRALNLEGGGQFAIAPEMPVFDALKTPKLSFDCRLQRHAAINLYLRVKGTTHSIRLTGPTPASEGEPIKVLWTAPDVRADGQWHHVSLDLAALLKPLYPNDQKLNIEEIFFGNLTRDSYAQAGFGVNTPGTSYQVRSFALRTADNRLAKTVGPVLPAHQTSPKFASLSLPASLPIQAAAEPKTAAEVSSAPKIEARGLRNLRVTFCQDADGGDFKQEKLNQPINWKCFSRPLFTDKAETIDFNWAEKSPRPGIDAKYWSARFRGKLMVPQAGDYTFLVERLDDGARLYIDGKLVLDAWKIQAATSQQSPAITLTPGAHDIRLDYSQGTGLGSLALRWSGPGFGNEIIPAVQRDTVHTAMIVRP